jgi:hypothetical protein
MLHILLFTLYNLHHVMVCSETSLGRQNTIEYMCVHFVGKETGIAQNVLKML